MKKNLKPLLMSAVLATSYGVQAQSLEDRVEELETNALLNVVQWGGSLTTSYDSISTETKSGTSTSTTDHNPLRTQVAFDATAKVSDKVTFYSRFGASKFFNTFDLQGSSAGSFSASRDETGVEIYLERAYLNYNITNNIIASIGRLPTVDGTPVEMYDDLPRQGTYPLMAYGAQLDGMALTYVASFMPKGHGLSFRGIYSPIFNINRDSVTGDMATSVRSDSLNAPEMKEQAALFTGMLEYQNKSSSMWDELLGIVQYNKVGGIELGDGVARGTQMEAIAKSPSLGGDGVYTAYDPSGGGVNLTQAFAGSNLKFDFDSLTANFGLKNIANTGLNFGFTYYESKTKSSGFNETNTAILTEVKTKVTAASGATAGQAASDQLASKLGIGKGMMTDSSSATIKGKAWMAQVSYRMPVAFLSRPTIGFEYLKGDKNFLNFISNSEDLTNFYQTRGKAFHVWYTQPLDYSMKLRVGFRNQDHDYSKGFLGAPTAVDLTEKTMYANLKLAF